MLGQLVKTLVDEYQSVGYRQVIWDGTNEEGQRVASGVHVYRMTTGEFSATKRMLLIK
jgi:flagellar hook assembly protein FlgD